MNTKKKMPDINFYKIIYSMKILQLILALGLNEIALLIIGKYTDSMTNMSDKISAFLFFLIAAVSISNSILHHKDDKRKSIVFVVCFTIYPILIRAMNLILYHLIVGNDRASLWSDPNSLRMNALNEMQYRTQEITYIFGGLIIVSILSILLSYEKQKLGLLWYGIILLAIVQIFFLIPQDMDCFAVSISKDIMISGLKIISSIAQIISYIVFINCEQYGK